MHESAPSCFQGYGRFGCGLEAETVRDHPARCCEFFKIASGVNTHAMQHIDDVFCGYIAGCAGSRRATAQAGPGAIDHGYAELDRGEDVSKRLSPCVMEVDSQSADRHMGCDILQHALRLQRRTNADGIAERDLVATHGVQLLG